MSNQINASVYRCRRVVANRVLRCRRECVLRSTGDCVLRTGATTSYYAPATTSYYAPSYSSYYAPAYTTSYAPSYTAAYAPEHDYAPSYSTYYAPAAYTTNYSGWYPGQLFEPRECPALGFAVDVRRLVPSRVYRGVRWVYCRLPLLVLRLLDLCGLRSRSRLSNLLSMLLSGHPTGSQPCGRAQANR